MSFPIHAGGSFWDDLINWNWNFGPIWEWLQNLAHYWFVTHGVITVVVMVLVTLAILLSFDVTNGIATSLVSGLLKVLTLVVVTVPMAVGWKLLRFLGAQAVARFRDAVRYVQVLRQPPPK